MFPYRVKYNESESDIQNNDLLYKVYHKFQNTFEYWKTKFEKEKLFYFVICISYIIHIWNYYVFVKFVIWGFVYSCSLFSILPNVVQFVKKYAPRGCL